MKKILFVFILNLYILPFVSNAGLYPTSYNVDYQVYDDSDPRPVITITADPTSGLVGSVHGVISWSVTNNPISCEAFGDWSGPKPIAGINEDQGVLSQVRTYIYAMTCENAYGTSDMVQATVNVTSTSNQSPTANAGPDQIINLPTSGVSVSGSGSDSDGSIISYLWTKESGPSGEIIVAPSSPNTSIIGLVQGSYVFRLTVTDDQNATGYDEMQVTVNSNGGGMSGTLTPDTSICYIMSGSSSCFIDFSWSTINPQNVSSITSDTPTPNTVVATGNSGNNIPFEIFYGGRDFYLYNNGSLLDQESVSSDCDSGLYWNGSSCQSSGGSITANIIANPETINLGSSTLLSWTSNADDYCISNFFAGQGVTSGSQSVTPPSLPYTYTIDCYDLSMGQHAVDSVQIFDLSRKKPIIKEQ